MSEFLAIFPFWFFVLLAMGVVDALCQFSDYREWRKERRHAGEAGE